jgi:hypothetical protein
MRPELLAAADALCDAVDLLDRHATEQEYDERYSKVIDAAARYIELRAKGSHKERSE